MRPVFPNDADAQYVIDRDGHTQLYGVWLLPDDADVPLVVAAAFVPSILSRPFSIPSRAK